MIANGSKLERSLSKKNFSCSAIFQLLLAWQWISPPGPSVKWTQPTSFQSHSSTGLAGVTAGIVCKWRAQLAEKDRGHRAEERGAEGPNPADVRRIMKKFSLHLKPKRNFVVPTDSNYDHEIHPNFIVAMAIDNINQVWTADITYIRIRNDFV